MEAYLNGYTYVQSSMQYRTRRPTNVFNKSILKHAYKVSHIKVLCNNPQKLLCFPNIYETECILSVQESHAVSYFKALFEISLVPTPKDCRGIL
jgi:hypothetical protein